MYNCILFNSWIKCIHLCLVMVEFVLCDKYLWIYYLSFRIAKFILKMFGHLVEYANFMSKMVHFSNYSSYVDDIILFWITIAMIVFGRLVIRGRFSLRSNYSFFDHRHYSWLQRNPTPKQKSSSFNIRSVVEKLFGQFNGKCMTFLW
jgi:hypothetical protein